MPSLLYKTAKRAVSVRTSCVEKDTEPFCLPIGIDALPDGARRIAAAHGQRLNQEVRERVQQHIGPPRKWPLDLSVLCPPLVPDQEAVEPSLHARPGQPGLDGFSTKL